MSIGNRVPIGSVGGGGASIIPKPVALTPGSSSCEIQWPAVSGATIYEVFLSTDLGGPWVSQGTTVDLAYTITGLDSETAYYASVTATVVSAAGVVSFVTAESVAPTTPQNRQIWDAGWNLTNYAPLELIPEGQRRTFRAVVRNLTGSSATGISLDLVQGKNAPSTYDVAVGPRDGETFDSNSWQVSQVTIPAAPNAPYAPGYFRHVVVLSSPVANDGQLVISIRPADRDVVTTSSLSANSWPTVPFADGTAMSNADIAVDAPWPGGTGNVFAACTGISFLGISAPCIQIAHVGDSVGSGIPPIADDYSLSRGFWTTYGNLAEVANGRRFHWSSIANGTYTIDQYLERVAHLVSTSWINTVDVVSLQVWTHNQAPGDVATAQAQWVQFEVVANAIRALSRGVIYTMLTPPSYAHQTPNEVAAWQWMRSQITELPHVFLDDLVADGSGTALDAADSADLVHINTSSQVNQGNALPARTSTALLQLGYSV